jgi:hypothetical protein
MGCTGEIFAGTTQNVAAVEIVGFPIKLAREKRGRKVGDSGWGLRGERLTARWDCSSCSPLIPKFSRRWTSPNSHESFIMSSRDPLFFRVDGSSHSCCFIDPDEDPLPLSNPGNLPRKVFVPDAVDEEVGEELQPVIPISSFLLLTASQGNLQEKR